MYTVIWLVIFGPFLLVKPGLHFKSNAGVSVSYLKSLVGSLSGHDVFKKQVRAGCNTVNTDYVKVSIFPDIF